MPILCVDLFYYFMFTSANKVAVNISVHTGEYFSRVPKLKEE